MATLSDIISTFKGTIVFLTTYTADGSKDMANEELAALAYLSSLDLDEDYTVYVCTFGAGFRHPA